jgi:hypothetical protein
MAEKEICRPFTVSAIQAFRNSQFSGGEYLQLCYTRMLFKLENGQLKWEYTDVPSYLKP